MVGCQLVQALIVERGHQLGIDRLAVAVLHRQRPLLLLSWCQAVAEGSPLQMERLVGQRPLDKGLMGMGPPVLHPGKGEQQTAAVVRGKISKKKLVEV